MSNQELILNTIKTKGPVIPNQIAKVIETDILFASAHLSELVSSNKLKVSHTKVGGTPVYYLPGQESRLQEFHKYLNDKEQKAFNLLKEKQITRDDKQDPVIRVALRAIKDFAVPVYITVDNQKVLFWKWYLLSNDEAGALIRLQYHPPEKEIEKPKEEIKEKKEQNEIKKPEEKEVKSENIKAELKKEEIKEPEKKIVQLKQEKQTKLEHQQKEIQEQKPKHDPLLNQLNKFFHQKKIEILNLNIIRKNAEIDSIVRFSSVVGDLEYYCKAKNKKSISDTDLSNAFIQGQIRKLPVLFLMIGKLTKKAEELLNSEFKKGLIVKKI